MRFNIKNNQRTQKQKTKEKALVRQYWQGIGKITAEALIFSKNIKKKSKWENRSSLISTEKLTQP